MKAKYLATLVLASQSVWAAGNIGGMDGGGGGTLPAQPVPVYKVQEIVYESQPKLLFLFNDYEMRMKYGASGSLLDKLFLGPQKVQQVLKTLRVEVREDQPCYTSGGTEVDGSIYGVKPNTICISADRISSKLDQAVAEREILALLAHEVSHFMGADEAEATELQKDIASALQNAPNHSDIDTEEVRHTVSKGVSELRSALEEFQKKDLPAGARELKNALLTLGRFRSLSQSPIFSVFGPLEIDYQDLLQLRLDWALKYCLTQIQGPNQAEDINDYEAGFGGRDHFLFSDVVPLKGHSYAAEKVAKLHSLSEVIDLLSAILREYEVRSAYVYQVSLGNNWVNVDGHRTKTFSNPWEDFKGTYQVQDAKCSGSMASGFNERLKEIRVYRSGDTLFLGMKSDGVFMNDRIELGAYNVNASLNDFGYVTPTKAYMVHEKGGTWSRRVYVDRAVSVFTLETQPNQRFRVEINSTTENRNVTGQDSSGSCVLTGSYTK